MIGNQVRKALDHFKAIAIILKGIPYRKEYDLVPYMKGFVTPSF